MIKRLIKRIVYRVKYRGKNIRFAAKVNLKGINMVFEDNIRIGSNTSFQGSIGRCSYIGENCRIKANIGRYCSIASDVRTIYGKHPTKDWVSTSPVFFSDLCQCGVTYSKNEFAEIEKEVEIGSDVWIGENVSILGGVQIGHGAIIAAGAVVVHNVEPYSIVGGVPAKEIRKRFTNEEIHQLLELKWWEKDEKWIKANAYSFKNVSEFLETVRNTES